MNALIQEALFGLRMLVKRPGFTTVAVFTLALGIGANTAIFSVVNAVLLRPLPYKAPERLVFVWSTSVSRGTPISGSSMPDYREWRAQNGSFEDMAAVTTANFNLAAGDGDPERITGARVTSNFFDIIGVHPQLGRGFNETEEQFGHHRVAVLDHRLWENRFASSPGIVGGQIRLGGEDYTVVGVMPQGIPFFDDVPRADLYVPLSFAPNDSFNTRANYFVPIVARLKPAVSLDQAQADMDVIAARMAEQLPENAGLGAKVVDLREQIVGDFDRPLWVLLGVVGFVLLVACLNVANLLLARAAARQKEFAIRAALGARRGRLVRQLMVESLILSALGGVLGLAMAVWSLDLIETYLPRDLPRFNAIGIDGSVLAFTIVASAVTALIFGIVPAFQAARRDVYESLKEAGRTGGETSKQRRLRPVLVVCELALALVLLVGAGLMALSYYRLQNVDSGFQPGGVLTMQIPLSDSKYPIPTAQNPAPAKALQFYEELLARVRATPAVELAGVTTMLPMGYGSGWGKLLTIVGQPEPPSLDRVPSVLFQLSSTDYLPAIGARLRAGRFFTQADTGSSQAVAIVNETFVNRFMPGEDPIGREIYMRSPRSLQPPAQPSDIDAPRRVIIGVLADLKNGRLNRPSQAEVYAPYTQSVGEGWGNTLRLAIRSSAADPMSLVAGIRAQVSSLDPDQPVSEVASLDALIGRSTSEQRFNALLMTVFASLALLLAAFGTYGVISYTVEQRSHEIGVRMALGAQQRDILRSVVGNGLLLAVIGAGLGLAASAALSKVIQSLLFEVQPTDLITYVSIALLLLVVAAVASYLPARRASRIDPIVALRYE